MTALVMRSEEQLDSLRVGVTGHPVPQSGWAEGQAARAERAALCQEEGHLEGVAHGLAWEAKGETANRASKRGTFTQDSSF